MGVLFEAKFLGGEMLIQCTFKFFSNIHLQPHVGVPVSSHLCQYRILELKQLAD